MATEQQRREWVKAELALGETISWLGFPDPVALAAQHPIRAVDWWAAFGTLAAWVLLLSTSGLWIHTRDGLVGLTVFSSLLFSAAFSYFFCRHPFGAYGQAQEIVYALTDLRAFILQSSEAGKERSVRSFGAEDLSRLEWRERLSNAGVNGLAADTNDLVFPHLSAQDGAAVGFLAVRDSRTVEQKVRGMMLAARV